jgi:hypothetical protein
MAVTKANDPDRFRRAPGRIGPIRARRQRARKHNPGPEIDSDFTTSSFSPGGKVDAFKRFAQGMDKFSPSRAQQIIGWLVLGFILSITALVLISGLLSRGQSGS